MPPDRRVRYAKGNPTEPTLYAKVEPLAKDVDLYLYDFLAARCERSQHVPPRVDLEYLTTTTNVGRWFFKVCPPHSLHPVLLKGVFP